MRKSPFFSIFLRDFFYNFTVFFIEMHIWEVIDLARVVFFGLWCGRGCVYKTIKLSLELVVV